MEASSPAELIETALGFLRRQYWVILLIAVLTLALAAIYVFITPPSFTAQANLLIDTRKLQVLKEAPILSEMNLDAVTIESQIEIIRSDNVALAVIKNLRLFEDPDFVGSGGSLMDALSGLVSRISKSEI